MSLDLYDEFTSDDSRMARCYLRRLAALALVLIAVSCTAIIATKAHGEPVYRAATADGVSITLHDETCAMLEVANLPRRATWVEGGKTFEGCWGARPDVGVVMAFFSDRTVVAIPMQAFLKVQSI